MSQQTFYKPELDTLRFFTFLGVFAVHAADYSLDFLTQHGIPLWAAKTSLSFAHAGVFGVDVFFVLSAYLITNLLLLEKDKTGSLNVRAFYLRRILRIWPLYYLFIALAALIPYLVPEQIFGLRYVLTFLVLGGNWGFVLFGVPNSIAVPLWSISVEEQFYLFWPPLVAKLSRRQLVFAAVALILVANLSRILALAMHGGTAELWMNTFPHLDSIAAGILVAVLWHGKAVSLKTGSRMVLVACGVFCLGARAYMDLDRPPAGGPLTPYRTLIGDPMAALACTAILIGFIDLPFRSRVLEYFGKISYGLYVYHLGCLLVIDKLFPGGNAGPIHACMRIGFALGLTVAISAISYRIVERPFLNLKRRFTYVDSRPV